MGRPPAGPGGGGRGVETGADRPHPGPPAPGGEHRRPPGEAPRFRLTRLLAQDVGQPPCPVREHRASPRLLSITASGLEGPLWWEPGQAVKVNWVEAPTGTQREGTPFILRLQAPAQPVAPDTAGIPVDLRWESGRRGPMLYIPPRGDAGPLLVVSRQLLTNQCDSPAGYVALPLPEGLAARMGAALASAAEARVRDLPERVGCTPFRPAGP